jgi:hypothetical protein
VVVVSFKHPPTKRPWSSHKSPTLFAQHCQVEEHCVTEPYSSLRFWYTHIRPVPPMQSTLIYTTTPPVIRSSRCNLLGCRRFKNRTAHRICRYILCHRLYESLPGCTAKLLLTPSIHKSPDFGWDALKCFLSASSNCCW